MKNNNIGVLLLLVFLVANAPCRADEQLIDVVHLNDGTVLKGLIVEQSAGVSLKLATPDRLVYTLSIQEVNRVEKQKTREALPFYYTDVIVLRDGVMFRGTIVEQRPEMSLTLQTENEILLTFPVDEIWKILKEKRIAGTPIDADAEDEQAERQGLKIALQIELVRDEIRKAEGQKTSRTGAESELGEEIDRLKEQMQTLEEAEDQIEDELITDRRTEEREKLLELEGEIEELLEELNQMLEECAAPPESDQSAGSGNAARLDSFDIPKQRIFKLCELTAFTNDVSRAAETMEPSLLKIADRQSDEELSAQLSEALNEIVEQTIYRIPTQEEIDALQQRQAAYASITAMLGTSRWKVASTRRPMRDWAELLPAEDRVFLYEAYNREDALLAMCLNLIPVANVGSFVQGNIFGVIVSITPAVAGIFLYMFVSDPVNNVDPTTQYLSVGGLAAGSYTLSLLLPFSYQRRWNMRLKDRLLLDDETIREVKREERRAALNPPAIRILPGGSDDLAVQLDLVRLSY